MWLSGRVIAYGRRVRMLNGLSPRSALLDVEIGVVTLALSLVFGRHAALSQPGTRPLDALGYLLVVMSCAAVWHASAPLPSALAQASTCSCWPARKQPPTAPNCGCCCLPHVLWVMRIVGADAMLPLYQSLEEALLPRLLPV